MTIHAKHAAKYLTGQDKGGMAISTGCTHSPWNTLLSVSCGLKAPTTVLKCCSFSCAVLLWYCCVGHLPQCHGPSCHRPGEDLPRPSNHGSCRHRPVLHLPRHNGGQVSIQGGTVVTSNGVSIDGKGQAVSQAYWPLQDDSSTGHCATRLFKADMSLHCIMQ